MLEGGEWLRGQGERRREGGEDVRMGIWMGEELSEWTYLAPGGRAAWEWEAGREGALRERRWWHGGSWFGCGGVVSVFVLVMCLRVREKKGKGEEDVNMPRLAESLLVG